MTAMLVIAFYFVVGAVATAVVNKKKPGEANKRWTKYLMYLVIVFIMLAAIQLGFFLAAALTIFLVGAYEVLSIGRGHGKVLNVALIGYALIGTFFLQFARYSTPELKLQVYVVILVFDGFSQIFGQLLGKTKLAPKISPGKTVEGLVGGSLVAVTTAFFVWDVLLPAVAICAAALTGDLLASYYKRKCNVKDYSNLIPGHGGVLDRFDSLIFAGASIWLLT